MFGAFGILATLGLGMALLTRNPSAKRAEASSASASVSATLQVASMERQAAPVAPRAVDALPSAKPAQDLWLRIPPQTTARVNGNDVTADAGRLAIHGLVGETPLVELSRGKLKFATRIAITDNGLLPDHLDLAPRASSAPATSKPTSQVSETPTPAAAKVPPTSSATRPSPKLVESTSEF
jgi:hypothetical protein